MFGWRDRPRATRAGPPRRPWTILFSSVLLAGCVAAGAPVPEAEEPRAPSSVGAPVEFAFAMLDGHSLSTESLRGRISAIGFIATYDVASQAQARFLAALARRHVPRINVALLVLEPPENVPMIQAFADALPFRGPVAVADAATIAGKGPFAGLHHVPSVVLLDSHGVERWRSVGLTEEATIDQAVRRIEAAP